MLEVRDLLKMTQKKSYNLKIHENTVAGEMLQSMTDGSLVLWMKLNAMQGLGSEIIVRKKICSIAKYKCQLLLCNQTHWV